MASWIIAAFPEHRIYVEPFGGAGSVLMKKDRSYSEVYNDLNDDLYNFFQVMRDRPNDLMRVLELTPFCRREFEIARISHPDQIEKARRLVIRSFMGFGSDSASNPESETGFRSNSNRSNTTPAHDWMNYPNSIHEFSQRLRGVVIENRDAFECMLAHDGIETLHYIDPPYLPETRKRVGAYKHEFTHEEHVKLLDFVKTLKGSVVLSAYESSAYDTALSGWVKSVKDTFADGARPRQEVLWIKRAC